MNTIGSCLMGAFLEVDVTCLWQLKVLSEVSVQGELFTVSSCGLPVCQLHARSQEECEWDEERHILVL